MKVPTYVHVCMGGPALKVTATSLIMAAKQTAHCQNNFLPLFALLQI
jgi:hypothetical protein